MCRCGMGRVSVGYADGGGGGGRLHEVCVGVEEEEGEAEGARLGERLDGVGRDALQHGAHRGQRRPAGTGNVTRELA